MVKQKQKTEFSQETWDQVMELHTGHPKKKAWYERLAVYYVDTVIRSLIILAIDLAFIFLVFLKYFPKLSMFTLPVAFIIGLCLSPLVSYISVGKYVNERFLKFIDKTFGYEE